MYLIVDAISKKSKFDVEKRMTKITMFDLELGDDIDLKFPGDVVLAPGTPIKIEGLFTVTHFQSGSYLTAVQDKYSITKAGRIVYDPAPAADSPAAAGKEKSHAAA